MGAMAMHGFTFRSRRFPARANWACRSRSTISLPAIRRWHLCKLPIARTKIDKSFARDALSNQNDDVIVRTIIFRRTGDRPEAAHVGI